MTRGQSETLGYVLVFSLIMLTVGTVYVAGFESIDDAQQDAQVDNMGRAFDVLADNVRDNHRYGAPRRATEIKLGDGSLGFRTVPAVRFEVTEPGTTRNATFPGPNATVDALTYRSGDAEVVYSGGAVIRARGDRATMASPPRWVADETETVVPIVLTNAGQPDRSLGGPNTLLVRSRVQSRTVSAFAPRTADHVTVNVTVTSAYAEAWSRYFESEGFENVTDETAAGGVTYQFETARFAVVETQIAVTMQP